MTSRLLFVDDEPSIRATLPAILTREGFDVTAAASVPEALELITREKFDVLVSDLNIGQPGDGFTVVSAMRRTQPNASTFILTGFPDFHSALEAIRRQVDDYLTKPADVRALVEGIKTKLQHPRHLRDEPAKPVAAILQENADEIVARWISEVKKHERPRKLPFPDGERLRHMPRLLEHLARMMEARELRLDEDSLEAAAHLGLQYAAQGYPVSALVDEAALLHAAISGILQEKLLEIDTSTLVSDSMRIGEYLDSLLACSIRAFETRPKKRPAATR